MTNLMHFFNRVAGFALYNDKSTFVLYLALCAGMTIKEMQGAINVGRFEVIPGMLQAMMTHHDTTNEAKVLEPMFLKTVNSHVITEAGYTFNSIVRQIEESIKVPAQIDKMSIKGASPYDKLQFSLMVLFKNGRQLFFLLTTQHLNNEFKVLAHSPYTNTTILLPGRDFVNVLQILMNDISTTEFSPSLVEQVQLSRICSALNEQIFVEDRNSIRRFLKAYLQPSLGESINLKSIHPYILGYNAQAIHWLSIASKYESFNEARNEFAKWLKIEIVNARKASDMPKCQESQMINKGLMRMMFLYNESKSYHRYGYHELTLFSFVRMLTMYNIEDATQRTSVKGIEREGML